MSAVLPTQPLYTVRFTIVDVRFYSAAEIRKKFEPDLKKLGFLMYQTPAVNTYVAGYSLSKEGPFEGDDAKSVYETMSINGPADKSVAIAKDITNDPMGTRPILETRKPRVTAIAWNLGPPKHVILESVPKALADAVWRIRKEKVANPDTMTGIGWTPLCASWQDTPVHLPPYPDRPPIPASLLPHSKPQPKPEPAPVPVVVVVKPKPKPVPPPPPPPPPPVVVVKPNYWKWGAAGLGGLLLLYMSESR